MVKKIGEHNGAHFYTIGQRKGLNIGGFAEPLFIIGTNVDFNQVYTGMGKQHPGLFRKVLRVNADEIHWVTRGFRNESGRDSPFKNYVFVTVSLYKQAYCTVAKQECS